MQINALFIRETRTRRGWTQQQLADICGLSLRTIQRVELHGIASLETSKALASAFEVDRSQFEVESNSVQKPSDTPQRVPLWLLSLTFITGLLSGMVIIKLVT